MSPGPISEQYKGPPDDGPYVPSWCYDGRPPMCKCGHHEGWHNGDGHCLRAGICGCTGFVEAKSP